MSSRSSRRRAADARARTAASTPFGNPVGPQAPANAPPQSYNADQPPPAPVRPEFRKGYHDKTFRAPAYLRQVGGWDVNRMQAAIEEHDVGIFLESYTLSLAVTRFAPIYAALRQRVAPILGLLRKVDGGTRGLPRIAREAVEEQLAPTDGDHASVFWPAHLWGSIAIDLAMMGFSVVQHVYGEPDRNGWRPCYSRRYPPWGIQAQRWRRTYVAITMDGPPIDIIDGDGKWTLFGTSEEPHLLGAVRALGTEYCDGGFAKQARAQYIDQWGLPHAVGTMPPNVGPSSPEGDLFFQSMQDWQQPGGVIALPHGASLDMVSMDAGANTVFTDALSSVWQFVAAALLGSDGTLSKGTGGVYTPPFFAGVREDLIRDDVKAIVRGTNSGRVRPWVWLNLGEVSPMPALSLPLPDSKRDERTKARADRMLQRAAVLAADRAAGVIVDQAHVDRVTAALDLEDTPLVLAGPTGTQAPPGELAGGAPDAAATVEREEDAADHEKTPDDPRGT